MELFGGGCQVCDTTARLVCANCVGRGLLGERWANLQKAQQHRDVLLGRLERLLAEKEQAHEQQRSRTQLLQDRQAARQRCSEAEAARLAVQAKIRIQESKNAEQSQKLEADKLQLERQRSQGTAAMQEVLRARGVQLRMLLDSQSSFIRLRVHSLLEVLPISIPALRQQPPEVAGSGPLFRQYSGPSNQQAPYVTIRGLRLPDTLNPSVDSDAEAQKLGTALGYVLLLMRTLAHYLHAPLLHCLVYQASTSSLGQLPCQWDPVYSSDDTASTLAVLHVPSSASIPAAASSAGGASTARSSIQSSFDHYRARLGNLTLGMGGKMQPAIPPINTPQHAAAVRSAAQGLPTGLHALARSLGALLAHAQSLAGARLPADWNPFACLAAICAQLAVDPRAERRAAKAGPASSMLLRSAILRGSPLPTAAFAQAFLLDGEDEDDVVDGWDMVQRPAGWGSPGAMDSSMSQSLVGNFQSPGSSSEAGPAAGMLPLLPPTPSQSDDVRHWERAMFTDSTRAAAVPPGTAGHPVYRPGGVVSSAALERTLVAAANVLATPATLLPFRRGGA